MDTYASVSQTRQTTSVLEPVADNLQELDKGNIANAITDDFMEDVGISQNQFNVGQQLMSLGIVLFEFPSNMVLYRVGPARWLTAQMFLLVSLPLFPNENH